MCDDVTVLFPVADLAENTNNITIFAPPSCHYVRQKGWYSPVQVLQYSSACDSNTYCQPPFNYISKVGFLNFSVILALKVLASVYCDIAIFTGTENISWGGGGANTSAGSLDM